MEGYSFRERVRYAYDNIMTSGTAAQIGWLAFLSAAIVLVLTLIVWLVGINSEASFFDQTWVYLMLTLEAEPAAQGPWPIRLTTFALVLTSIFVISTLIGLLTTGLEGQLEKLHRGRSKVVESGHTVILGWTEQIHPIISEFVIANENQKKARIVVLGDAAKSEMEDTIAHKVGDTRPTRIICRRGVPVDPADLEISGFSSAKSIIILGPEDNDPDLAVIKTLMAITRAYRGDAAPFRIVAELSDRKNLDAARIASKGMAEFIITRELIGRITAQSSRQSGLSTVYTELLDFAGDEIYFKREPTLVGRTYGEALFAFDDSAIIGLWKAGGGPSLNPAMDTPIGAGDELIAISEDDDTVQLSGLRDWNLDEGAIREHAVQNQAPECTLILGWNRNGPMIVRQLDHYVPPGSRVAIHARFGADPLSQVLAGQTLENLRLEIIETDTTDRAQLDSIKWTEVDHVILLPYSDDLDTQHADAKTLISLLHLREISSQPGNDFTIVSEMMDVRNRDLADISHTDDFIVSRRIVSLILSQISENHGLGKVFEDLFDPDGVEIYLKPVIDYVEPGRELNFYTVLESARRRGETAIGYRKALPGDALGDRDGIMINPVKSHKIVFDQEDMLILLAAS